MSTYVLGFQDKVWTKKRAAATRTASGRPLAFGTHPRAPYTAGAKHAILGVGGVGGLIGAALARAGEDVVLLMRGGVPACVRGVIQVESVVLGDFKVDVRAAPVLEGAVDVLWVTPKATQLEPALTLAPPGVVNGARVVTLMNGVDHLRLLQSRYEHVIGGAIRVESERASPGHIRQASPFIRVELCDGQDSADLLERAGFEAELGPAAGSISSQKLAFLAPLAFPTTAYDKTLGQVRQREDFQACQAETVAIAKAEGATLDIEALEALEALTSGAPAEMRSSMQKDNAKGLPLELDAIAGPIIRGGVAHEIAAHSSGNTSATCGDLRAHAGRIAEENRTRAPVTSSTRSSLTRGARTAPSQPRSSPPAAPGTCCGPPEPDLPGHARGRGPRCTRQPRPATPPRAAAGHHHARSHRATTRRTQRSPRGPRSPSGLP